MRQFGHLLRFALLPFVTLGLALPAIGQLTITNPDDDKAAVQQVSLSSSAEIAMAKVEHANRKQLRVTVRYLHADAPTRQAIYTSIGPEAINTTTFIPRTDQMSERSTTVSPANSGKEITSASRVTTAVLEDADVTDVLQVTQRSADSNMLQAPTVILLEDKKAELTDLVQRPFMVNLESSEAGPKPIMQVIDEGIRLGILANLTHDASEAAVGSIQLSCEIVSSRVLDVKSDLVFNVSETAMTVQVPTHQITTAAASVVLSEGQTLLIDPHVSTRHQVQSETSVPVLSKLPYLGRSFKNVATDTVEQHMIVLLTPTVDRERR